MVGGSGELEGSVVVVGAGPVGGVVAAQVLGPFNQPAGLVKIADSSQRQGQLAGLGGGHPGAIGGAAHALVRNHELVPAMGQPGLGRGARQRSPEHRVVPIHRPPVLGLERLGAAGYRGRQAISGRPPSRPRMAEGAGDPAGADEAEVDRGGAGQETLGPGVAVEICGPADGAAGQLEAQCELDGGLDCRPQPAQERGVAGGQMVQPGPGGFQGSIWPPGNQGMLPSGS